MTDLDILVRLAAETLELPPGQVRADLDRSSFVAMGGSSLQAVRLSAAAARRHLSLPLSPLLGPAPIGSALRAATPLANDATPTEPPTADRITAHEPLPSQMGMLQVEDVTGGTAYHLLFTAEVGGVPATAIPAALARLTMRHESLRTVFLPADPDTGVYGRRVLAHAAPRIRYQVIRPERGADPVTIVHEQLARASTQLLRPFDRPPVCFTVTTALPPDADPVLLVSISVHHTLVDGWAIGILFEELAELLAGTSLESSGPSPEILGTLHRQRTSAPGWPEQVRARAAAVRGAPAILELPSDAQRPAQWEVAGHRLPGTLRPAATRAWNRVAETTNTTTTAVLLAAYALVLARRCGVSDLLVGVAAMRREDPDTHGVIAPCAQVVPVRCRLDDNATAASYVASVAAALAEAIAAQDLPFERLVGELRAEHDRRRNPVVQFVLGVHDDLVPERFQRGDVTLRLHEGHAGGAAFDATLFVQRGGAAPRLVLEYATAAITPEEAADLLDAVDTALVELDSNLGAPLAATRTISAAEQARLNALRDGPALPAAVADADMWSLVVATARLHPAAPAVRDGDIDISYADLVVLASAQAAALTAAGIGDGDPVVLAMSRGATEIVSILAVLAIGAHYVAIDPSTPEQRLRVLLGVLPPTAVLAAPDPDAAGFAQRLRIACPHPVPVLHTIDPALPAPETAPPASPEPRGDRIAYVAFTSGSTGVPKAVRVPHRGVARLVWPGPDCCVQCGPGSRMLRLAPLAFDASTLEMFAPLAAGGCVEVYPPGLVTPGELADFLLERQVTVVWLTSGLFRLVADFAPEGFARVSHVLSGGDVVAPEQVRSLLARHPGLCVSNGYGPTENSTLSTVAHYVDPSEVTDPLPIGTPLAGSGVLVLDANGQPVPPGGIGELYVTGLGLAVDYAGAPEQTAAAFRTAPDTGEPTYRTGDLVRLTGAGALQFLGRRDHQVKIRGFRVELDEIRRVLADQPGVRDAVVVSVGADASARRLAAGLVPRAGARADVAEVAARLRRVLPGYAVPSLWAVLDEIPLTGNGKVDAVALEALATPLGAGGGDTAPHEAGASVPADTGASLTEPSAPTVTVPDLAAVAEAPAPASTRPVTAAELASAAWAQALGRPPTALDRDFFRAGGDSLSFARMLAWLRNEHGVRVAPREFYSCPTPRRLSELIGPEMSGTGLGS